VTFDKTGGNQDCALIRSKGDQALFAKSTQAMKALSRLVTAFLVAWPLYSCCDVEPEGACIPWVSDDETYDVELLQRIDLAYEPGTEIPPFSKYPQKIKSCGLGLDLGEGTVLTMRSDTRSNSEDQCSDGCYEYRAHAQISGVSVLEAKVFGQGIGEDLFLDSAVVKIGTSCEARYSVGIMPLSEGFATSRPRITTSDYVLFRELVPSSDRNACDAAESMLLEDDSEGRCYDSWFVRVTDSSGRQVTQDLALSGGRSEDAGT